MKLAAITLFLLLTCFLCVGTSRRMSRATGAIDTWTPSNRIADVAFWYRADRYTFSDNGTTPSVDGGVVQQWSSMTGDVNRALRDNGATHRPLWKIQVQNGMPAVFFNGAMWFRSVADLNTPFLGTIYIVALQTNVATFGIVWSHDDSADTDTQLVYFPGGSSFLVFSETGVLTGNAVTTTTITSEATICTGQSAGSALRYVWKNGAGAGTNTTSVTFTGSFEGMYVGNHEGTSDPFLGYIFEIVGVTTVDTEAQRLQMHNYLDRLWAVPGYPP